MKKLILLAVVVAAVPTVFGQARMVDNFTLDKFKQQRLAAEKDLRENYAKLGFPSPEEMERQRERDADENAALLDKIREERLERERIDLERQRIAVDAARVAQQSQPVIIERNSDYGYGYGYGGVVYSERRWRRGSRYRRHAGVDYSSYRITPVGIFPNGHGSPPPRFIRPRVPTRRR